MAAKQKKELFFTFILSILLAQGLLEFTIHRYPKWDPHGMRRGGLSFIIGFILIWVLYLIRWIIIKPNTVKKIDNNKKNLL